MRQTRHNDHPGPYKVSGRDHEGEKILHDQRKALLALGRGEATLDRVIETEWPAPQEEVMPDEETLERARRDEAEGKSPSTQAGEFVREEIHHVREGKLGARSAKQAIAFGLSKARRAGVKLGAPARGSKR